MESSNGISVDATIELHPVVTGDNASSAWSSVGGSGGVPCVADPQTDGVMVGTLSFTNTTPSYTPDFYVNFNQMVTGGGLALGTGYSSGNKCITDDNNAYQGSVVQPIWDGDSWGPVPITIVIHDDIGPDYPSGDPSKLGTVEFVVNSQSGGGYGASSQSGIVSQLNGPVMQLHLESVQ